MIMENMTYEVYLFTIMCEFQNICAMTTPFEKLRTVEKSFQSALNLGQN